MEHSLRDHPDDLEALGGHTALVEASAVQATGRVTSVEGGIITITCDQECWTSGESQEVSISVFAPQALFHISGQASAKGLDVMCNPDVRIDRIQRRRWPRKRMDLVVTLCPVEEGVRLAGVPGRTVDVSVGGVCCETVRPLEGEGDPMVILNLPDGTTIVSTTTTVEAQDLGDGWRYRLAFRDLDAEDAARLEALTVDRPARRGLRTDSR